MGVIWLTPGYGLPAQRCLSSALAAFAFGKDARLSWHYGVEITRLVMAAYMAAERRQTIDLTDPATQQELETFVPAVQQGLGRDVLY